MSEELEMYSEDIVTVVDDDGVEHLFEEKFITKEI